MQVGAVGSRDLVTPRDLREQELLLLQCHMLLPSWAICDFWAPITISEHTSRLNIT
jgi:hypothetical protein